MLMLDMEKGALAKYLFAYTTTSCNLGRQMAPSYDVGYNETLSESVIRALGVCEAGYKLYLLLPYVISYNIR